MARAALTTEEMLTPPPIARPERVDRAAVAAPRSARDDRFDLPPGEIPPGENPVRDDRSDDPE